MIHAVLLTGTIGAGKTSVAVALGELMDARGLPTAVIDLDWLGWVCGTEIDDDRIHELIVENLRAVVPVFVSRGLERFVLVRGIGDERQVELIRTALGAGRLRTVRLTVPWARIEARLRARDSGALLARHLEIAERFAAWPGGDLEIENGDRPVVEVSTEIADWAGWA